MNLKIDDHVHVRRSNGRIQLAKVYYIEDDFFFVEWLNDNGAWTVKKVLRSDFHQKSITRMDI